MYNSKNSARSSWEYCHKSDMFTKNKNILLPNQIIINDGKKKRNYVKFVGQAETWSRRELNENWTKSCTMRRTCDYM